MEDSLETTNLDSQKFDSRKYLTNFLKTNSLNQLIQKNNELHQSIRSCDHDIQNLVFENYQKFLTSIDTVKKMKGSINKVEQRIQNLSSNMTKINSLASNIHAALSTKHEAIQELDIVGRDLARLKQVCEFPSVLKQELQREEFSQSVELYQECWPLIDNFKNESLIKGIYRDVMESLNQIRFILFKRQKEESNQKNSKQILKTLIVIQEDQELVIKTYIKSVKDQIIEEIKKHAYQYKQQQSSTQEDEKAVKEKSLMERFLEERQYQVTLEELQQRKAEDLMKQGSGQESVQFQVIRNMVRRLEEEAQFLLVELRGVISRSEQRKWKQKQELGILSENESNLSQPGQVILAQIQQIGETMIREVVGLVLDEISKRIIATFTEKSFVSNEGIMQVYKELREQLQEIFQFNVSQQLKTNISDKVMTSMQDVFLRQVYSEFAQLKINMINLIILIKQKCLIIDQHSTNIDTTMEEDYIMTKKAMFALLTEFKNRLYSQFQICLIELRPLAILSNQQSEFYIQKELFQQINAQALDFFKLFIQVLSLDTNKFSSEWVQQIGLTATMSSPSNSLYTNTEQLLLKLSETQASACYYTLVNNFLMSCSQGAVLGKCEELITKAFAGIEAVGMTALEMEIPVNYIPANLLNFLLFRTRSLINCEEESSTKLQVSQRMITSIIPQLMKFFHMELAILFPSSKKFFLNKKQSILSRSDNIEMERMLAKKAHHIILGSALDAEQCILALFKGVLKTKLQKIRKMKWISKLQAENLLADTAFISQIAVESVQVDEEPVIVGLLFEIVGALEEKIQNENIISIKDVENVVTAARNQIKV